MSFWSLNIGLAWMCFATLFPLGILQLYESVSHGYYEARTLEYITNDTNALFEWVRLPGDVVFIVGGVLPLLYLCYLGVRHTVPRVTMEEPEDILFTEIAEPETTGQREQRVIHPEVLLAAGYAVFLLGVSVGLDLWPATRTPAPSATGPPGSPTTTRTTPGSAPKTSSSSAARWTTSGA